MPYCTIHPKKKHTTCNNCGIHKYSDPAEIWVLKENHSKYKYAAQKKRKIEDLARLSSLGSKRQSCCNVPRIDYTEEEDTSTSRVNISRSRFAFSGLWCGYVSYDNDDSNLKFKYTHTVK